MFSRRYVRNGFSYCCGFSSKTGLTETFANDQAVSQVMNYLKESVIKDHHNLLKSRHEVEALEDYTTHSKKTFQSVL